jgi:hypothetical protein
MPNKNRRQAAQPTPAAAGPATAATNQETKIEATSGPSQEKERQRLAKMGLFEVPVAGSPYSTLKVEDGKIATLEQRVEMARRHNEIAPHLPKYVKQQTKIQPENNDMARAKKDKGEKKAEAAPATAAAPQSSDECNLKAAAASATAAEQDKLGIAMEEANEEILAAVKKDFPSARTSAASIAWYRSKLREEGKLPKA